MFPYLILSGLFLAVFFAGGDRMGNFLLMTGVGVIFIFGLYLMKRFGVFIEKNETDCC